MNLKTLRAGAPGTKKWLNIYGEKLLAVRYKYDIERKKKYITVELIVEEKTWHKNENRIPDNKIVKLIIRYGEIEIARRVKSFNGTWNKEEKVWELPFKYVKALKLEERMI